MQARIDHVKKLLSEQKLDAVLISSIPNIIYLSNYHGFIPDEREAFIFVTKTKAYLLTNVLYAETMPKLVPHLQLIVMNRSQTLTQILNDRVRESKIKTMGYENDNLTVIEYLQLQKLTVKLKPVDLVWFRDQKEQSEIAAITKACEITDKAFSFIKGTIKPGITETELGLEIERFFLEHGAKTAFRSIVAYGKNSSVPHHLSGETRLKNNDVVLIDFGAKVNGYCADMSRCFFVGKASAKHKEIYNLVRETQLAAQALIRKTLGKNIPIVSSEVDSAARSLITSHKYPSYPYSLGHGIGLEVHERPYLNPSHHDEIKNNMVFTLEPGIHLPDEIGIRIEDMFTIRNNKLIQLTHSPTEIIEL